MGDDEELEGVEEVLPDDVGGSSEGGQGIEEGICHPDAEGGVLLTERLSGCDGRDFSHRGRCSSRVDEYVLVVTAFGRSGQVIADQFAEAELEQADKEGGY